MAWMIWHGITRRWNGGGGEEMVWWRLGDDGVVGWKWDGGGGLVKKG